MRMRLLPVIVVTTILSSAGHLRAEPRSGEAVALGHDALELFRQGNYEGALTRFQNADAIAHSPVFALYVARCQRHLGRLLQARQSYRAVLNEALDADAPEPWRHAQANARVELAELSLRIPSIIVEAAFVPRAIELDGEPLPLERVGVEVELDPGPHRVIVHSSTASVERSFDARAGVRAVRLLFVEPPTRKASPPPKPATASSAMLSRSDDEPNYAVIVPIAVGTAALAVGATAGIVALVKTNDLKARCDDNVCDPEDVSRVDPIQSWATVSTVAFAVAGAGFAVGAVVALAGFGKTNAGPHAGLLLSGEL